MKIQINSLEALERMIGNDNALEIEVRNSIVQEFCKKHLKHLVDQKTREKEIKSAIKAVREEIQAVVSETLGRVTRDYYDNITGIDLHPMVKRKINSLVADNTDELIGDTVRKCVEQAIEKEWNESKTREYAERFATSQIYGRIRTEILKAIGAPQ